MKDPPKVFHKRKICTFLPNLPYTSQLFIYAISQGNPFYHTLMTFSIQPQHKVIYECIYEERKEESNFLFLYRQSWQFTMGVQKVHTHTRDLSRSL